MIMVSKEVVLVTGGTGFIGSHTVIKLIEIGFSVLILDNLSNSKAIAIDRIHAITGVKPKLIIGSILDKECLRSIFKNNKVEFVLHFAGLKAVFKSETDPISYYVNNVAGSLILLQEMARASVKKLVFSSSATVYSDLEQVKYTEQTSLSPNNVYGKSKLIVEDCLRDLKTKDDGWRIAILRYFNPVGAHISGLIGEDPLGQPDNLIPYISQVAIGKLKKVKVFGGDYPTPDGTCFRDYIHVDDLARGHIAAMNYLSSNSEMLTLNLGTGRPHSVLEMIYAFEKNSGKRIPYRVVERRQGDLPVYFADAEMAEKILGWKAEHGIDRMCLDVWRWISFRLSDHL